MPASPYMNFCPILEGHSDIVLAVHSHEVYQRPPQTFIEFRHHLPLRPKHSDKFLKPFGFGVPFLDILIHCIIFGLCGIVAADQLIVPRLVFCLSSTIFTFVHTKEFFLICLFSFFTVLCIRYMVCFFQHHQYQIHNLQRTCFLL